MNTKMNSDCSVSLRHPTTKGRADTIALARSREDSTPLLSPAALRFKHALSLRATAKIAQARSFVSRKLESGVGPPIAIVGPCSIHCEEAALEYAERLVRLRKQLSGRVQIIMRVYFEKPRTTTGWKGFLYDPDLNGACDLAKGLGRARALLVRIAELGLPMASEILDPIAADYFSDCLTWAAVGARTSESQIHRQMASSLHCPVGFKNATDGSVLPAIQAMVAASTPHTFLGVDEYGCVSVRRSAGNADGHVVLRGGHNGPNYSREDVALTRRLLLSEGVAASLLIDCSHGNSGKDYRRQAEVAREVMQRVAEGLAQGLMLESHLREGRQDVEGPRRYGVSVTDACIDFEETEEILRTLSAQG
jgi:3-deoxy-7-phosphoheptulonate synthase